MSSKQFAYLLAIAALVSGIWWYATRTPATAEVPITGVATYLSAEEEPLNFTQATIPNNISFPQDLGPHNDFQTEWWYYTGNLKGEDGRQFGYQFTIFRRAIDDQVDPAESEWRTNQLYFAHFALTDVENGEFYSFEKFSRGAAGLAGAIAQPYEVWIEDWSVVEQPDGSHQMYAHAEDVTLELNLTQTRPPVLHGQGGLSAKGPSEGNASYYYSLIDQTSVGTITIGDDIIPVEGHSWKDHEYSTSVLEAGAVGWDWLSLQFDNSNENGLMYFQIRRDDGSVQPESGGSWIAADSSVEKLALEDITLEATDFWTSPATGIEYPVAWRISSDRLDLDIAGRALIPNQELLVSTVYWEGAVQFEGTLAGEPVSAEGYIELTGYEQ